MCVTLRTSAPPASSPTDGGKPVGGERALRAGHRVIADAVAIRVHAEPASPRVCKGYHQEDHWALHWEGPWQTVDDDRAVLGATRRGSDGATLAFTFVGDALELVARRSPEAGRLRVTVDGTEHVVDLRADTETWQVMVPVVSGLSW